MLALKLLRCLDNQMSNHSETPLQLFLIRHGQTEWSLSGKHTGRTDIPLTSAGQQMARELAPRLAGITFSTVLSSPRQRARETCELAGLGATASIEDDLAEWDYGQYEGLRSAQIRIERPGWDIWRDGCPAGESPEQASARADRLVKRLLTLDGNVALFTHGHFGRVLATRWIAQPVAFGRHLILDPATLCQLGLDAAHGNTPVIQRWNASA